MTEEEVRNALTAFYRSELLARRAAIAREPAEPTEGSYYVDRGGAMLTRADFEISLGSPGETARELDAVLRNGPFEGLGAAIVALQRELPAPEQKDEVSSFVYEMF